MGLPAIKLRPADFDKQLHYKGIKSKITTIKKHWPGNEKVIRAIMATYEGMIVNLSQKLAEIYHVEKNIDDVIETVRSFFIQLLWEYDLGENVDFTTYLRDHLFYRVKNFYKRQNGTLAYWEACSPGRAKGPEPTGSNDDPTEEDCRIRYVKDSPLLDNRVENISSSDEDDRRSDSGLRRVMAADMWKSLLKTFDESDIDLIICSDLLNMKQREIGELFGLTQPDVCEARKNIALRMRRFVGVEA